MNAWESMRREAQKRREAEEFLRRAQFEAVFGRTPKPADHPWRFTPDHATVFGAINLTKGNDGVWR